ncbi:DUF4050 family protein [Senna tora]|uniref:DUF4050 family protein n=1 Tax=Senna tora TaxID=362788 RepID=A0A834W7R9_9FABA|nr:DUF4050 family protein [Senna tora]
MRKPTMSDNFWSSSTCDLDNSTIQSQRSISSVSTLNQLFYDSSEASTAGTHPEFINQGKFYVSLFFSVFFTRKRAGFNGLEIADLRSKINKNETQS